MQYPELIAEKVAGLRCEQQAEILRYIEAVAGTPASRDTHTLEQTDIILQRAWGAWGRMGRDEIDRALAAMREEWEPAPPSAGL